MYHWQMTVGGFTIIGRKWEEWLEFIDRLEETLHFNAERQFVLYVHNLGFEFQFIRDFLTAYFSGFSVFASKKRAPIWVYTGRGVQFRCSYKLTNMSLDKATANELGVVHGKAKGDLDYSIFRTWKTPLTLKEIGYCVSDAISLYELIECKMKNEHDNLETIPMTSTGYVRRMCRKSCKADPHYRDMFLKTEMTPKVYQMLLDAGRGGNTHANRYMSGKIWREADSFDVQSSYPFVLTAMKFPITRFEPYGSVETMEELSDLLGKYACLFYITLVNPKVGESVTMPYIPVSKCLQRSKACKLDNGRVLEAEYLRMCITDIDYKIIAQQYEWDSITVDDMYIAKYDYLPDCLVDCIRKLYAEKCELKHKIEVLEAEGKTTGDLPYLYSRCKNRLNGIFGMAYSKVCRETIIIDEHGKWDAKPGDIAESLSQFYKSRNSFLYYAWGVWCTCWARLWLQNLLDATGDGTIYCDTDSSKAIGVDVAKIEQLNIETIKLARERRAYATVGGEDYYMGIYEHENKQPIDKFITLGAKKYAYEDEKGLHITISGVNKKLGANELNKIENFSVGFTFKDAGGITLYYNDNVGIHTETINGVSFTTASNIGAVNSTYTLGVTDEYAELVGLNVYDIL